MYLLPRAERVQRQPEWECRVCGVTNFVWRKDCRDCGGREAVNYESDGKGAHRLKPGGPGTLMAATEPNTSPAPNPVRRGALGKGRGNGVGQQQGYPKGKGRSSAASGYEETRGQQGGKRR